MPHTRVCVRVRPGGLDSKGGIPPSGTCCSTPGQYEVDSIIDAATSSSTELFTNVCQHAVAELVEVRKTSVCDGTLHNIWSSASRDNHVNHTLNSHLET